MEIETAQLAPVETDDTYERPAGMSDETASMIIEAHGEAFTVEQGMRNCKPFRQMAEAILSVPGGEEVFKLSVNKMAETAIMKIDKKKV